MKNCILFYLLTFVYSTAAEGFVEEVSCSSDGLTVVLNKSDDDIARWMADPAAQPVAYVYGFKERTPCGFTMKSGQKGPAYKLTVPYGQACGVYLTDLEPVYQTAETTIAMEDNSVKENSKTMRINHVFCVYTRRVEALQVKDITKGHQVLASTGGKPKPKVQMLFQGADGKPVRSAKFGDTVGFYLALSPDNAYKAIAPKECMFTDRENMHVPEAKKLTFVQSNCPVTELQDIISPLTDVNEEVYYTTFKTFRFGDQTTVYAHCTVQVCLTVDECKNSCFRQASNDSLLSANVAQARARLRRDTNDASTYDDDARDQEVAITSALTILNGEETDRIVTRGTSLEMCLDDRMLHSYYILVAILTTFLLISCILIGCLVRKIRVQNYADSDTRTLCSSAPPIGSIYAMENAISLPRANPRRPYSHYNIDDYGTTLRSVSEMSAPHSAWMSAMASPKEPRM